MALMQVPCEHYKAACLPWKQTLDGWMETLPENATDFLEDWLRDEGMMQKDLGLGCQVWCLVRFNDSQLSRCMLPWSYSN